MSCKENASIVCKENISINIWNISYRPYVMDIDNKKDLRWILEELYILREMIQSGLHNKLQTASYRTESF